MPFNIDDYIEVKDRVKQLKKDYPDSVIQTDVIELTDTRVTIKAFIYLDNEGKKPTTGHSYMNIPGTTSFTRGSELENAETSAVGRAIANLGYAIDKSIASRDEVQSKQVEEGYEAPKSQRPPQQGQYLGNARTYSGPDTLRLKSIFLVSSGIQVRVRMKYKLCFGCLMQKPIQI